MDFSDVVRRRRMVRSFDNRPVDPDVLERILGYTRRAPSAGNTHGTEFVVLEGADETSRYWDVTLPPGRRERFGRPGLLRAPVLVIPVVSAGAYVARYSETDKQSSGLGEGAEHWSVPYWFTDAAFAAMLVLLGVVDEGLGALFFGVFEHEQAVRAALAIPDDRRLLGAIAIGHPDPHDTPGRSAARGRPDLGRTIHRGGW